MGKRIVFQGEDGILKVITPFEDFAPVEKIALKDVPDGVEFWIIEESELPEGFREAWEVDLSAAGKPDGVGSTRSFLEWLDKEEAKKAKEKIDDQD